MKLFKFLKKFLRKKKTLEIATCWGRRFTVDISDKICLKFGFKHGNIIITPDGTEATIVGVGSLYFEDTLWYIQKGESGASHFGYGNLREAGARLKGEEEKK